MTVSKGNHSVHLSGHYDDGSDESIISPNLAERASVRGIGKNSAIHPVTLRVPQKSGKGAQVFKFLLSWVASRTVLQLSSERLALLDIRYLVADDYLICEVILIGLPVLRHLIIDTKTLLDANLEALDRTDCSVPHVRMDNSGGYVTRAMRARLNSQQDDVPSSKFVLQREDSRPRVSYFKARSDEDTFPVPALLDPVDYDQKDDVLRAVKHMVQSATDNDLLDKHVAQLRKVLRKHLDVFCTSFSA